MSTIRQFPQQVRVAGFTSIRQPSDLHQHSTLIGKVHLPMSNQPSHFIPKPASHVLFGLPFFFDLHCQNLMPFSTHDHPLSSTHDYTNIYDISLYIYISLYIIYIEHLQSLLVNSQLYMHTYIYIYKITHKYIEITHEKIEQLTVATPSFLHVSDYHI